MTPSQPARAVPPAVSSVSEAARVELLECFLVHHDDSARCASEGLEWLARHAGVKRSLCLAIERNAGTLVEIARFGLSGNGVEPLVLSLASQDPIVEAVAAVAPVVIRTGRRDGEVRGAPLGAGSYSVVPLVADRDDGCAAVGALLLKPAAEPSPEVMWLAAVLGQKIEQIQGRGSPAAEVRRLRRECSLLFTIINAVTDPILLTDQAGRLVVANARAEKLFSAGDQDDETHRRAVEVNNMLFSAALTRGSDEGGAEARELLLVDPNDGSDLLFEVLSSPVEDRREGTGIVSVLRNITDLRRATEQIEENYQRLRVLEAEARTERDRLNLIIDSVADPIVVTDPTGATVLMNAPAEELFTVPPDAPDQAERNVRENAAHFSSFIAGLLGVESGPGDIRRGEMGLVNPVTSETNPVEAIAGRVQGESGELSAVVTILHDRKEALERGRLYEQLKLASDELQARVQAATVELATQNELLRRQAIELEQASRLKSQFLANMSHEFRTPLNAILGYTHMLLHGVTGDLSPAAKRQLQRIDSNGRHLLTLINEILDITRIEAGKMPIQLSEFSVNDIVREVMTELDPVIGRSKLTVTARLSPQAPPVCSDRQKVKQIVVNLLSNALKFTHHGGVDIAVEHDPGGAFVAIAVSDTGIGIAPEHHERIFEDFRQVDDSPSRQYGGTGLGLAICRRLATSLGGRISLRSNLGQGSTFTLTIPAEAAE